MNEQKHTPTPYTACLTGIADERGDMLLIADLGDNRIESIGRLWNTHDRAQANAEFIVRACNAFGPLVTVLQKAIAHIDHDPECPEFSMDAEPDTCTCWRRDAKSALAAADEKE